MKKLCICQICTCGHHRCPHRPWGVTGKGDLPCSITEYKNEYRSHDVQRRKPFKPELEYKADTGPLQDVTTHKHDYIRHAVEKIRVRSPEHYKPPEGEFDGTTSYNKEYVPKKAKRPNLIKHEAVRKVPATFDANPTYKDDYRRWEVPKIEPIKRDAAYVNSSEPFSGNSTYDKDYIRHHQPPRPPIKPDYGTIHSSEPFDDRTGYRLDYTKHSLPLKHVRPKDEYQQNRHPLENMTTNRRDYTPKEIEKIKSFKPEGVGYRSEAPFDDATTNKQDYKKWDVKPHIEKRDDTYRPPQGEMETLTNYNREFTSKPLQRVAQIRPASRKTVEAKFEGDTTYGQDFRQWPGDRAKQIRSNQDYMVPTIPFDAISTYKTQFIPHKGVIPNSFKPDNTAYRSDAPFDDKTLYRLEYTPKEVEPCPAALLETQRSGFIFTESDNRGHKYYQPSARLSLQNLNKPIETVG